MFLHHTMTDSEILRSCEGCTSQHLRLVADRLRVRVDGMRKISSLANAALVSHDLGEIMSHDMNGIMDTLREIVDTADNKGE